MKKQRHGPPKLEITATVYHITRQESYYQVCFQTVDGEPKEILMGREVFSKPARVVDELLKAHAALPDSTKAAIKLVKRALAKKSNRLFRVTSRTGWYGDSFVYLTETFGSLDGKMQHEGHTDIDPALGQQLGKMKTWREGMRRPCKYSDFLIFTISIATSGPLLELIGEDEGAIYHLQPEHRANSSNTQRKVTSSSGKTLAARAGLSVIGRCRKSDLVTFAATERGVEDFCFAHNHLVAVFDEEGRALTAGHGLNSSVLPYLVTSGVGKLRSNKATRDRDLQNLRWSLPAISTGENPLDDPSKRAARAEGAQARMIPVPVPPGDNGGIFNLVEGSVSNAAKKCRNLARHLEKTIEANYGVLMPAYLKKLVPEKPEISRRVRLIIDRFVKRVRADQDPWEQRFAAKFGIVLAAAILLSEFGLAPWTKKRARKAITAIYKKARRATSVSTDEAADALLSVVRKHVKAGKRFPTLNKGQELATKRASSAWGAIVKVPGIGRIVAVPYTRVEGLVNPAAITQPVLRTLADRKVVVQSSDGKLTRQVMLKGVTGTKRPRRVCFDYNKIMKRS
jgi:putative DNA primase/helicase